MQLGILLGDNLLPVFDIWVKAMQGLAESIQL